MEFGPVPPHEPDPSHNNLPEGKSKVEKDLHDLSGLTVPQGSSEARRIAQLLRRPTERSLNEAREIFYDTESRPVLTFVGAQLAKVLTANHIGFAVDLLKRGSLCSTDGFVRGLVTRELKAIRYGLSSPIAGASMAPLRAAFATLCVNPNLFFPAHTRELHQGEIDKLLLFPIVLLRRSAGPEVASVLVKAATRGGIDPESNRRALEALTYLEDSHPEQRVVSAEAVSEIVGTMGSFLRDPLNHMDAYAFVERWLQKPVPRSAGEDRVISGALHALWAEHRGGNGLGHGPGGANLMDVVALLRHFDDPVSRLIGEQAGGDLDAGVALLSRLFTTGPNPCVLSELRETALKGDSPEDRFGAIRVLGYALSAEHDAVLRPVFSELVTRAFGGSGPTSAVGSDVAAARPALVSVMERRLFTQPLGAPFTTEVLADSAMQKAAEARLVVSTLLGIARQGRVMPLAFYDEPTRLAPVGISIELLRYQAMRKDPSIQSIADDIEGHFILDGPARFGFQLTRTRD